MKLTGKRCFIIIFNIAISILSFAVFHSFAIVFLVLFHFFLFFTFLFFFENVGHH